MAPCAFSGSTATPGTSARRKAPAGPSPATRVAWLVLVIAMGAAVYGLALVALGLRPRDLRH